MAQMLWSIVDGSEACPNRTEDAKYTKFVDRRDLALAIVVLWMDPALLYLIGDLKDPIMVTV
jgi:hypothetical protein